MENMSTRSQVLNMFQIEEIEEPKETSEIEETEQLELDLDAAPIAEKSPYKRAMGIKLFDEQGNELADYKGIANEAEIKEVFGVTSKGYKIIQHEDVLNKVEEVVSDLKLNHNRRIVQMNNGARLHTVYNFPEIKFNVEGKEISLNCSWDNSYDQTTGVRMTVGAYMGHTRLSLYLGEKFSRYYHKHTQGLNTDHLVKNLQKGIDVFESKVKSYFEDMTSKMWTREEAVSMIEEAIEEKLIAAKYGDIIKTRLNSEDFSLRSENAISQWNLYLMMSEILERNVTSMDARNRYSDMLQKRMAKK